MDGGGGLFTVISLVIANRCVSCGTSLFTCRTGDNE